MSASPENVPDSTRRRLLSLIITYGYWLGALGFGARCALWLLSEGTNDIRTWYRFARTIQSYGLGATYTRDLLFNHPPLMGLLSQATALVCERVGVPFAVAFKLYGMLGDLGSALLLVHIWRRRGRADRAALAFAAYGWALSAILISGYHGNTDPLYWFLVLCSVYFLQDRSSPFGAGLLMGAALEVKLIPMLVVLPLAACCRDLKSFVRYGLGTAVGLVPFAWIVLRLSPIDQASFARNVFGYTSYREFWGLELVLRALDAATAHSLPEVARYVNRIGALWGELGSKFLLAATTCLAAAHAVRRYRGLDAYAVATLAFCMFLVFASGFGVQYMGAVAPLMFACRIREGFAVTSSTGVFIGLIYTSFVTTWRPIFSQHSYFSASFAVPSFIAWCVILRAAWRIWRTRAWPAPLHR